MVILLAPVNKNCYFFLLFLFSFFGKQCLLEPGDGIKWNLPGPRMTTCPVVEKVYELMNSEELSEHLMVPGAPAIRGVSDVQASASLVLFG